MLYQTETGCAIITTEKGDVAVPRVYSDSLENIIAYLQKRYPLFVNWQVSYERRFSKHVHDTVIPMLETWLMRNTTPKYPLFDFVYNLITHISDIPQAELERAYTKERKQRGYVYNRIIRDCGAETFDKRGMIDRTLSIRERNAALDYEIKRNAWDVDMMERWR